MAAKIVRLPLLDNSRPAKASKLDIELTVFHTTGRILSKRMVLTKSNKVRSDASQCGMSKGTARQVRLNTLEELAELIETMPANEALVLGRLGADLPDQVAVVTKENLGDAEPGTIARTREHLRFAPGQPAYMLLDHDGKGTPEEVRIKLKETGGFWSAVVNAVTGLGNAAYVSRRSTSTGLYNKRTGEPFPGSSNRHLYVAVKDGADIERALKTLHERLWLAGYGYYVVGAVGQLLDRSIIDASVYGAERLVFEGGPEVVAPLAQDPEKRRPQVHDGDIIDTRLAIPPLSKQEQETLAKLKERAASKLQETALASRQSWAQKFAARRGLSPEDAERIATQAQQHILEPDFELQFDQLGTHTVREVLDDPEQFLHQTLADPLEGVTYGRGKAKLFRQHDQLLLINSFAHGGIKYQLLGDVEEEEQEVNGRYVSQSDILIKLVAGATLFHDSEGAGYADLVINGHRETYKIDSTGFRRWLKHQYFRATKGAANPNSLTTALGTIDAMACHDGPEGKVHLRVAHHDGKIYLDLCDPEWRAVEIDENGWRVVKDPPVHFIRGDGMEALPEPMCGGSIDTLRGYLNIRKDADFVLAVAWLLGTFHDHPYAALAVVGEQGTAKTTLIKTLRRLIDPNKALVRTNVRNVHELFITATSAHVLVLDNLSELPDWLSNNLATLCTGGSFGTRQLYIVDEERLFTAMCPIILGSITDVIEKGDLAERTIRLQLEPIPSSKRRLEREYWAAFKRDQPAILGALLDGVVYGLRELPNIQVLDPPRMADFYEWGCACEGAYWETGTFKQAYAGNRAGMVRDVIDADVVAGALQTFMKTRGEWSGTATELLRELDVVVSEVQRDSKGWPHAANVLANRLNRVGSELRKIGIVITQKRLAKTKCKFFTLKVVEEASSSATKLRKGSVPSVPSVPPSQGSVPADRLKNRVKSTPGTDGTDGTDPFHNISSAPDGGQTRPFVYTSTAELYTATANEILRAKPPRRGTRDE